MQGRSMSSHCVKLFRHAVWGTQGLHQPGEDPSTMFPFAVWHRMQSSLPGKGGNETYDTWALIGGWASEYRFRDTRPGPRPVSTILAKKVRNQQSFGLSDEDGEQKKRTS